MLNTIRKDKNRRILVRKFEIQRLQNKALLQDSLLTKDLTLYFAKQRFHAEKSAKTENEGAINSYSFWRKKILKDNPRNSSKNRVKNRCIESGRSRAVLRFCKLSRICFRDRASQGLLPGVSKASW